MYVPIMGMVDWASARWDRRAGTAEPAIEMGDQRLTLSQAEVELDQRRAELLAELGSSRKNVKMLEEFEAAASMRGVLVAQLLK